MSTSGSRSPSPPISDPEVLIIDEVLAVGDHEFQQRCMGRIEDISGSGRTVLFVSHDMSAIARLCNRAYFGSTTVVCAPRVPSEEVVAPATCRESPAPAPGRWSSTPGRRAGEPSRPRLLSARVVDESGETLQTVDVRDRIGIEMRFVVLAESGALFPKDQAWQTTRGEVRLQRYSTPTRDGGRHPSRGPTRARPGSRRTCSTKA